MIGSGSFLGAIAFGLLLSKRWSFFVELIWGAMFISLFSMTFCERKYFQDASLLKVKMTCIGWLLVLWFISSFYLVTDYITSIWRPFTIIGTFSFLTFYDFKKDQKEYYMKQMFACFLFGAFIEGLHCRLMAEQSNLFLKSEVAKKQALSMKKVLFEIPDGVLITKFNKPSQIRFHNQKFLEQMRSFTKKSSNPT